MIGNLFRELAGEYQLTIASGAAYGYVQGCFVTLTETADYRRISIYVGGQEPTAPGMQENLTTSCARQILHMISTASGGDNVYSLLLSGSGIPALVLNHAGSVVTVNFSAEDGAVEGVRRFVTEMLPQVSALTRPAQCIYCCQMTSGDACPVRLAPDTVVPMHVPCYHKASGQHASTPAERKALLLGIGGAALGAIVATVIWTFCYDVSPLLWVLSVLLGGLPCVGWLLLRGGPHHVTPLVTGVAAGCAALLGSLGAALLHAHKLYTANLPIMQKQSISEAAYLGALFSQGDLLSRFLICLLIALIGAAAAWGLFFLFRKEDPSAATKLHRLKGSF